jgi:AcrR family transcriptional regulator
MPARATPAALRLPLQERSRRTLARLLDATEALLEERRFEEIRVEEIVRRARTSVGAFYARFRDKDAMLPVLYDRYDQELGHRMQALERQRGQVERTLEESAAWIVRELLRLYRERTNLMRALALYARTHADAIGPAARERRQRQVGSFREALLEHRARIAHGDPERAVELALFFAASALRERVLFADSTHAASTRLSDAELVREGTRLVVGYLTVPGGPR